MHQSILMHADIDKRTEGRDVGHHAFENHVGAQVVEGLDAVLKGCGFEFGARIAAGFFQLHQDVAHCRHAEFFINKINSLQSFQSLRMAHHFGNTFTDAREDAFDHRVRFRVYR